MTPEPRDLIERRVEAIALLPCPFCGGNALTDDDGKGAEYARCGKRDCPAEYWVEISVWNARPVNAELETLRLLSQNADSVMETNRVMGERLLEQKALLERAAEELEKAERLLRHRGFGTFADRLKSFVTEFRARAG